MTILSFNARATRRRSDDAQEGAARSGVVPGDDAQYGLFKIIAVWAAVAAPMGLLAWVAVPFLIPRVALEPGLVFWLAMIVGMMWQCVVAVIVLRGERDDWTWADLKRRLWLEAPRGPRPGRRAWAVAWWVVLGIGFTWFVGSIAADVVDAPWRAAFPWLPKPDHTDITTLVSPHYKGRWELLAFALVSNTFNYFLGEELLFRGVLLPKMLGVFGRWAWLANAVLFGLYHVHYVAAWPSTILGSLAYGAAAQRFRCTWLSVAIHGFDGVVILAAVIWVILGGPA